MLRNSRSVPVILPAIAISITAAIAAKGPSDDARRSHGVFTGDLKIVLYVTDIQRAVEYYRDALGFTFHHYHDYIAGKSVRDWVGENPPEYAEMSFAGRRFGIHLPKSERDKRAVGTAKVYFRVNDLDAHHRRVVAWGASPGPIKKRSWMDMFHVLDADGNVIYFAYSNDEVHGNPWYGT